MRGGTLRVRGRMRQAAPTGEHCVGQQRVWHAALCSMEWTPVGCSTSERDAAAAAAVAAACCFPLPSLPLGTCGRLQHSEQVVIGLVPKQSKACMKSTFIYSEKNRSPPWTLNTNNHPWITHELLDVLESAPIISFCSWLMENDDLILLHQCITVH